MRKLIISILSIVVLVTMAACSQSTNAGSGDKQKKVVIRVGNIYAQSTTYGKALEKFKEDVDKKSNGQIQMQIFHNGSLGTEKDHIEAVKTGSLEMMESGTAGIGLYLPETAIFEQWYSYSNLNQLVQAFDSLTPDLDKIYQQKGFKLLGAYYDGPRTILAKKKIDSLDGMKGLKFRVPGAALYVSMANALGAKAVSLPLTDVYTGIETGAIDAMEGTPDSILQAKFYEKAKFLIDDRHVYQPLSLIYSKTAWDKLSDEHKKIVQEAAKQSSTYHLSLVEKANNDAIEEMKKHGVEVVPVKDMDKWKAAVSGENMKFAKQYGANGELIFNKVSEALKK